MKNKAIPLSLLISAFVFFLGQAYAIHAEASASFKKTSNNPFFNPPADSSFSIRLGSKPLIKDQTMLIVNLGMYKQLKYIKVYDLIGKKVFFQSLPYKSGIIKINMALLKPGIYFCSVYSEKGLVETRKVINL